MPPENGLPSSIEEGMLGRRALSKADSRLNLNCCLSATVIGGIIPGLTDCAAVSFIQFFRQRACAGFAALWKGRAAERILFIFSSHQAACRPGSFTAALTLRWHRRAARLRRLW